MYVVLTLVPTISSTNDWMSASVMRLMWPFLTLKLNVKLMDFDMCYHIKVKGGSYLFVPNLQRLGPNGVEDGEEPRLESVLEHVKIG